MNKQNIFRNKSILITGGTGSFGSTICKYFLKENVGQIKIFSRDEKKQAEMRLSINDKRLSFYIGDIRDYESTFDACIDVDYIFHAAALKQVPSCEFHPLEAVKTNILGTENILQASLKNSVKKVILLSTDKAVYPINSMGISKAMMEKLMISKSLLNKNKNTIFAATRYGNVMCSRGSVIPLFVKQIKEKRPLTITDPNMTRFLMSLDEAVNLVFHAFENAKSGDIYIQKSSACTIKDLVIALKEIFNYKINDVIIGTRNCEKLYESLLSREEMARVEDQGKFFKLQPDNRDIKYEDFYFQGKEIPQNFKEYTSHNTKRLKVDEIIKILLKLDFIKRSLKS